MQPFRTVPADQGPPTHVHAIVLDDSAFDRRVVARVCSGFGIATDGAGTLQEFAGMLDARRYAIAFVDHALGAETGFQALSMMGNLGPKAPATRIMLTGNDDPRIADRAARTGCTACLAKGQLDSEHLAPLLGAALSGALPEGDAR